MYGDGSATTTGPSRIVRRNVTSRAAIGRSCTSGATTTMSGGAPGIRVCDSPAAKPSTFSEKTLT